MSHAVAWLTDLHLNFADPSTLRRFLQQVSQLDVDSILISGDIGEAKSVVGYLQQMVAAWHVPIYGVLGNHDFYRGGIFDVRERVQQMSQGTNFAYLTSISDVISLTPQVGLVGHDGWADGREGDYLRSLVMMNDYQLISELAGYSKRERQAELARLGDEAAESLRPRLRQSLHCHQHTIVLTHVPPFREACWYNGELSNDEWAPHFVCRAMGDLLLELAHEYPSRSITVLCGHTHSAGECQPAPNVRVLTGGAQYGEPGICRILDLDRELEGSTDEVCDLQ